MTVYNNLLFLLFCLIYILFPGFILFRAMNISLKDNSFCNRVLISFFLGFGVLVAEYFVCSLLGALFLFKIVSPLLLIIYIICLCRRIHGKSACRLKQDHNQNCAYFIIVLLCFLISFIYTTLQTGKCLTKPYFVLHPDFLFHVGLTASLSKGLPAADLRVSGVTLYYHFFSDLLFGMCENIFHIPAFELMTQCTPQVVGGLFGTALFSLLKQEKMQPYTKRDIPLSILRCSLFLLFGGTWSFLLARAGADSGRWNWNNYFIFENVNSCGFALPASIAVLIFIKNMDTRKFSVPNMVILATLVFVTTGAKGPFAVVLVAAFAGFFIVKSIVERKTDRVLLSYLLISFISFFLTYLFVLRGPTQYEQSSGYSVGLDWNGTLSITRVILFSSGWFSIPKIGTLFKLALVVIIAYGPLLIYVVFCFADELMHMLREKRVNDSFACICIAVIIVGACGFLLVSQSGTSQVYFLFVSIPPTLYLALHYVSALPSAERFRNIFCLLLVALFGAHLMLTDLSVRLKAGFMHREWFGYTESVAPSPSNISASEVEGLRWIYNNTPSDAVVLTDRRRDDPSLDKTDPRLYRFFGYSAISERQMYIEGFSYSPVLYEEAWRKIEISDEIYSASGKRKTDLLRDNEIDYIIVSKRFGTQFLPEPECVKICFENDDMQIYQVIV